MDINDSLTSASIIVLVVTIGKYFEDKVKQHISKMTDEIFPESALFENMMVTYAEVTSRTLSIGEERQLDVSLIEKNDIIRVSPGRVLVDLILVSGRVKATQSARTGNSVSVPICSICWIIERGIGVLVASCPCALGLAVPSVVAIILNLATKSGILIKNNNVFEKMKLANKICFDKTGTLFTRIGKIEQHIMVSHHMSEQQIWEVMALVEKELRHPLA
ncbi:unnamed protein product [Sphagnum balticum]